MTTHPKVRHTKHDVSTLEGLDEAVDIIEVGLGELDAGGGEGFRGLGGGVAGDGADAPAEGLEVADHCGC